MSMYPEGAPRIGSEFRDQAEAIGNLVLRLGYLLPPEGTWPRLEFSLQHPVYDPLLVIDWTTDVAGRAVTLQATVPVDRLLDAQYDSAEACANELVKARGAAARMATRD